MASARTGKHAPNSVRLNYQILRNITSPDEKSEGVQTFVVNLPAREILLLNTNDNLRGYLAEYNPRKRNRVHDAIRETINTTPERFIVRNSGFVITCADIHVDDDKKTVKLTEPSIINGAQSQGEIRAYFAEVDEEAEAMDEEAEEVPFFVRATIIVDPDEGEIIETAIARNIVTPVKNLSEAGARNQLDELEESIRSILPGIKIRKNEAQSGDDFIDTRFVLQIARLLMPANVSGFTSAAEKLRAYKNPEQCLTDFCEWERRRQTDRSCMAKYDFTVQIAPYALQEYERWEAHPGWNGHQIWGETQKGGRAVKRDKNKRIVWVSPGLLFPLMGAMGEFAVQKKGGWRLERPPHFKEADMIQRTVNQFRAHRSDPMQMGRSEAAYDALRIYPQTLVEVLRDAG
jgi:AIPR protein